MTEPYKRFGRASYFLAIPLPANNVLREKIAHRMTQAVGRPSQAKVKRFYKDFEYQGASWDKPRFEVVKSE